ncbi:hypothetical protein GTA08_BOTSDO09014 [Neofusicoccum parvum]|nr:hypothetical protein GTA08_BOTSDO09014 [Neofusicoccum parvum]
MSTSLYDVTVPQFIRGLKNLSGVLTKVESWCDENSKPHSEIIEGRLAPDMNPLSFQVRVAVMMATNGVLSSSWKWTPSTKELEDETSFAGLRAAIQKAVDELEAVKREDLEGRESLPVRWWTGGEEGVGFKFSFDSGTKYLNQFVIPNFWFHPTTAYAICRMKGVELGKKDFLCAGGAFD